MTRTYEEILKEIKGFHSSSTNTSSLIKDREERIFADVVFRLENILHMSGIEYELHSSINTLHRTAHYIYNFNVEGSDLYISVILLYRDSMAYQGNPDSDDGYVEMYSGDKLWKDILEIHNSDDLPKIMDCITKGENTSGYLV